ncbi:MBL fold metallo-hydrolase [Alkalihalobacillus sp. LMS6]|uniref:MBL fold metallo-hydrolase n=1 Tax=Alkalihalobacillus sp. LMS6 TaxID=2924034 RepID=UPI0020CFF62E|nr:MBL fold metallo-hydrolase [Alkalihalobacillus sp. LMS6]UTR05737.1 MBL fold metallo-hydrolase [Alkalihalobacillus sp. LMS6]
MGKQKYENPNGVRNTHRMKDFFQWYRERVSKSKDLQTTIPIQTKPDYQLFHNMNVDSLTWIGHATFLLRMNGVTVLADPVWANFMGTTKRGVPITIPVHSLPPVDFVVISHGHYDHLNFQTLKKLPGDPVFLVPKGLKSLFLTKRFLSDRVIELEWWEQWSSQSLSFTFVPAQHWVKRGLFDTNTSKWGGWVIEAPSKRSVYFVGDSGYFDGFTQVGQEKPEIDYAIFPIGAYEPEWFMELDHMTPEQAVQGFRDVGAKHFVPMHYGTFRLADDTGPEALERFEQSWREQGMLEEQKSVLPIGGTLRLDSKT